MRLPTNLFLASISPRKIYYFESDKLNTSVPHYFICLAKDGDDMVILVCCTSQFEKRRAFIESRDLPFSTLVWIRPDDGNGFEKDTYVDCNSYFDYTIDELKNLYESDELDYKGELSESHFQQIILGIKASPLVEENIKDTLPDVEEN